MKSFSRNARVNEMKCIWKCIKKKLFPALFMEFECTILLWSIIVNFYMQCTCYIITTISIEHLNIVCEKLSKSICFNRCWRHYFRNYTEGHHRCFYSSTERICKFRHEKCNLFYTLGEGILIFASINRRLDRAMSVL